MRPLRRIYYDLFSRIYDFIIRLHSRDIEGSLRRFITEKANLSKGQRVLDLCTGTGSVAAELAKQFPPETCTMCFSGSMQGIARGALGHDKVFCRMPKSLPGGDDCCEIIIEVKD